MEEYKENTLHEESLHRTWRARAVPPQFALGTNWQQCAAHMANMWHHPHDKLHLFNLPCKSTHLTPVSLWTQTIQVASFLHMKLEAEPGWRIIRKMSYFILIFSVLVQSLWIHVLCVNWTNQNKSHLQNHKLTFKYAKCKANNYSIHYVIIFSSLRYKNTSPTNYVMEWTNARRKDKLA